MRLPHPIIGKWYKLDNGVLFEVVAIDNNDRTIEVQHADGSLDEFDFSSWAISEISDSSPPDDCSGAYDMLPEDYGDDRESYTSNYRGNQLDQFD